MTDTTVHDVRGQMNAGIDWLVARTSDRVAVDLRALAAFRISLGAILLADLLLRSRNLTVFYTDRGVYPLRYLNGALSYPYSLHAFDGSVAFQAALFVVAGLFAVSLLTGYRTRVAVIVSWILLVSIQNRNPIVLNSGDVLLRSLLFWSIFLPLGERWSIDARRIDRDRAVVASLATLALLLQVVIVYSANAIHKLRSEEWSYGNAVGTILQLDQFTVLLGPYLAEFPFLARVVTRFWLALVVVSPLLLVLTDWRRALLATALVGMHLGMAASMQLGLFPLISVASLLVFYPPSVWDRLERVRGVERSRDAVGSGLDRLDDLDPLPSPFAGSNGDVSNAVRSLGSSARTGVLLFMIPMVLLSGVASAGYADPPPDPAVTVLEHTEMGHQSWQMFAPNPVDTTRYYVGDGNLTDGTRVDPFLGGSVAYDPPPNSADTVRTARWRKYLDHVRGMTPTNRPDYLGNYLCEQWNRTHDTNLANVSVTSVQRPVDADGPAGPYEHDTVVSNYDCTGDLFQA